MTDSIKLPAGGASPKYNLKGYSMDPSSLVKMSLLTFPFMSAVTLAMVKDTEYSSCNSWRKKDTNSITTYYIQPKHLCIYE